MSFFFNMSCYCHNGNHNARTICHCGHLDTKKNCHNGNMKLRIKEILDSRGITLDEFSDGIGKDAGQVSRFINGKRRTNTDFLQLAASFLDVQVSELFFQEPIPIVGFIGAGHEYFPIDAYAHGDGLDMIDAPIGVSKGSVAVSIRGDSMWPAYSEGDVIIYSERTGDIDGLLNKRCICWLSDGRILLKTPTRGAEGFYTLTSFNAPPITDVALDYVAKIDCTIPR